MSMLLIAVGGVGRNAVFLGLGVVPIAYLFAIGRRLSVSIDEEGIRYRGWLGVRQAKWSEVVACTRGLNLSYPRDRYYGPVSYEIRTSTGYFFINLMHFPPEFAREFAVQLKRHGIRPARDRTA